ncbi:hypothetical protein DN402_20125 [Streptomyces sp. SW4]|nr:hypothetical protein DN402_20125 [Streptomyces sp. SW4]
MRPEALPVPPPFMWACQRCSDLLLQLGDGLEAAAVDPCDDSAARAQIYLASHLAISHSDAVPAAHQDCAHCDRFARFADSPELWAEHRARSLFLPPEIARQA